MRYPEPIELQETSSTNSYLADLCNRRSLPDLSSVFSAYQTAGRGQRGNSWESEPGANLLFSFVVYPRKLEAGRQFLLAQITALALKEVLSRYTDGISIKWPNDIYWNDYKLCGTLIENDLDGCYIARSISGTGVNLNQLHFLSDAPNPISLRSITGEIYRIRTILLEVMERIAEWYSLLNSGEAEKIAHHYRAALYRREGFHVYRDARGTFRASIHDILPDGRLVLSDEAGQLRSYYFKEVSFVTPAIPFE